MDKHTYDDTNVIKTLHEVYRFADTEAREAIADCEEAITQNSAAIISLGGKIPESVIGDVNLTNDGLEKKINGEWQTVPYPSSVLNDGLIEGITYNATLNQLNVKKVGQNGADILQLSNDVNDVVYDSNAHTLTFKFAGGKADKVVTLPSNETVTNGMVKDVSKSGDNLIISYVGKSDKSIPLDIPSGDSIAGGKVDSVTYTSSNNRVTVTNKDSTSNTFNVESGGRVDGLSMDSTNNRITVTAKPYTSSTTSTSYLNLPNYVNDLSYSSTNNQLTVSYAGNKSNKILTLGSSGGGSGNVSVIPFKKSGSGSSPASVWGVLYNYDNCSVLDCTSNLFGTPNTYDNYDVVISDLTLTHTNIYIDISPQVVLRVPLFYRHYFGGFLSVIFKSANSTSVTLTYNYNSEMSETTTQGNATMHYQLIFT